MKIIYIGSISTTDSDFPLLREFQRCKIDFVAYFPLAEWNKRKGLIAVGEMLKKDAILKASEVEAFKVYEKYMPLDNLYVVNSYHYKRYQLQSWFLWIKVLFHILKQKADIIHFVWPPEKQQKLLYLLPLKRVLTVHDPFPHSGQMSKGKEKDRRKAFKLCDIFILLNKVQEADFRKVYGLNRNQVILSQLGEYDYLRIVSSERQERLGPFILFFGQIQPHKGVEYLLEAMKKIHQKHPNVKLIIAGKGSLYFDKTLYQNLDYIEIRNYYITVSELASLLQQCLFAVCPYKDATQSGVVQTAFSVNVPLIVTDAGSLHCSVKDGEYGLVVPRCDSDALAKAMIRLLEYPELLVSFRKNIHEKWHPEMSWEPIAAQYEEIYNSLVVKSES